MNDEQNSRPEEVIPAAPMEEGEFCDRSGSRITRTVPGDALAEDCESLCEDQSKTGGGRGKDPLCNEEAGANDQEVLAVPDSLGENLSPCDEEDPRAGILELREKLKELEERISAKEAAYLRLERECGEFRELYPGISLGSLSDSVWADVQKGVPVAAAYALYERRRALTEELAERVNAANKKNAPGKVSGTEAEFFSPAEVRKMSRKQVRENYDKIIYSMQKWN